MTNLAFDPTGFFEFDLAQGAVRTRAGERVVMVSESVLARLVSAAVKNQDLTAVRRLGRQLGEIAAQSLPEPSPAGSPESILGLAAGVLGVFGWGRLELDRWGDALLARIDDLPTLDGDHLAVAALLGGLFSVLAEREVACVPIGGGASFIVVEPSIAEQIWKWSRTGRSLAEIVSSLGPEGA